jgi:hypothetical protein
VWFLIISFFFQQTKSDFQKKRDVIKDLKRKALERNPDEFYFNMAKTQFKVIC